MTTTTTAPSQIRNAIPDDAPASAFAPARAANK
jgi:hypothetical protein